MLPVVYTPQGPLSPLVASLWALSDTPAHARERIVPSGTLELVFNLAEDEIRIYGAAAHEPVRRFSGAVVSGAYGGAFDIDTGAHACVIGVHFEPGGAAPFLGHAAGALAGGHADLDALWGASARQLRERLCAASGAEQRFQILEAALLARLHRARRPHDGVRFALEQLELGSSVGAIVRQVGLSHRRFGELFSAEVGMTPKLYARVRRFQHALARARDASARGWAALAAECRFFDQAHLIRDFRAFSGFSPLELLAQARPQVKDNHVALLDGGGSNSSNTTAPSGSSLGTRKRRHGSGASAG